MDQEFPFEAWDIIAQEPIIVKGWANGFYRLSNGLQVRARSVTTAFPAWYVRAQQAQADAADERETQRDALDVGVQR